jgi:hypothetical protein
MKSSAPHIHFKVVARQLNTLLSAAETFAIAVAILRRIAATTPQNKHRAVTEMRHESPQ